MNSDLKSQSSIIDDKKANAKSNKSIKNKVIEPPKKLVGDS